MVTAAYGLLAAMPSAEGCANDQYRLTGLHLITVPGYRHHQTLRRVEHSDKRDIRRWNGAHDLCLERSPAGQLHRDPIRIVHHMGSGEYGAIRADDDTRTQGTGRTCTRRPGL